VTTTIAERGHALAVDVVADHLEPRVRVRECERQADVPQAHHRDDGLARSHARGEFGRAVGAGHGEDGSGRSGASRAVFDSRV
jgi:hypothetical protein